VGADTLARLGRLLMRQVNVASLYLRAAKDSAEKSAADARNQLKDFSRKVTPDRTGRSASLDL
jgi:hypothetical protein